MASSQADKLDIPARTLLRAAEVCQIADLQPYVLRSWETEFPTLGVARAPGGARVYRRRDVERVLEIKALVFTEGLTVAGVKRRLGEPSAAPNGDAAELPDLADVLGAEVKEQVDRVKDGLRGVLALLAANTTEVGSTKDAAPTGEAAPTKTAKRSRRKPASKRR